MNNDNKNNVGKFRVCCPVVELEKLSKIRSTKEQKIRNGFLPCSYFALFALICLMTRKVFVTKSVCKPVF